MMEMVLMVGCLFVAQVAPPEPAANSEMAAQVRRLVRQLDAPQLDQRDAAEAALVKLGVEAIPLLPTDKNTPNAEVQQRLARVRQKLEQKQAAAAVAPSHVTLKKQTIRLSKLLEEINRQTGNRVIDHREASGQQPTDPNLTVEFKQTPFWQVLSEVLKQTGLTIYPFGDQRAVCLVDRPQDEIPFAQNGYPSGPFLFVPNEMIARRQLDQDDSGTLRLNLLILWEPRLAPIGLTQKVDEIEATSDLDEPIEVESRGAQFEVPVGEDSISTKLSLPFELPPREIEEISRLSGALHALIPGPVETFRFDKLAEDKEVRRRVASATVTLVRVKKHDEVWGIEIRVRFDEAGDALASHRGWIFNNEIYLEGPGGTRLENEGFETTMQTENEIGLTYFFDMGDSPKPFTLVYKTPVKIFSTQSNYELQNLKLP